MVVVIPSYNNARYFKKNLRSVFKQRYPHFRIIYIDDASPDKTGSYVQRFVNTHHKKNISVIKNTQRCGALFNHYRALHTCKDDEIIVHLDGDDWFAHRTVLQRINAEYNKKDIWLTYGQFQNWPSHTKGWCKPIPNNIVASNKFRDFGFCSAQPRTFFAWLGKRINVHDLKNKHGDFYMTAGDVALMFPMLEMAGDRFSFIDDVIYIRNIETPLNDFKIHQKQQERTTQEIRRKKKYNRLDSHEVVQYTQNKK